MVHAIARLGHGAAAALASEHLGHGGRVRALGHGDEARLALLVDLDVPVDARGVRGGLLGPVVGEHRRDEVEEHARGVGVDHLGVLVARRDARAVEVRSRDPEVDAAVGIHAAVLCGGGARPVDRVAKELHVGKVPLLAATDVHRGNLPEELVGLEDHDDAIVVARAVPPVHPGVRHHRDAREVGAEAVVINLLGVGAHGRVGHGARAVLPSGESDLVLEVPHVVEEVTLGERLRDEGHVPREDPLVVQGGAIVPAEAFAQALPAVAAHGIDDDAHIAELRVEVEAGARHRLGESHALVEFVAGEGVAVADGIVSPHVALDDLHEEGVVQGGRRVAAHRARHDVRDVPCDVDHVNGDRDHGLHLDGFHLERGHGVVHLPHPLASVHPSSRRTVVVEEETANGAGLVGEGGAPQLRLVVAPW
mmetsp:Transcript_6700/g.23348  ORF Transcript_6700/g.23348 Transcript_6700/m.23348 type:complete len:421 (+) Transcript_6700:7869-9131(+)